MLLQDRSVLGQKSLLLHRDDVSLAALLLRLKLLLCELGLTLLLVNSQLLLPESLDLPLVFQLTHATSLGVHLLESVILCELLHKLALEFFLHAQLFSSPLGLKSELVLTGRLELFTDTHALLSLCPLLSLSGLFAFLDIEVVSKLLLEHFLSSSLLFLGSELLEDLVTKGLSLLLHSLDLVLTGLLLLSVPSDHLILVSVHLSLALEKCPFLVYRKDHISLTLLFLLLDDAGLLIVLLDHSLNDSVNLLLLSQVLFVGLVASIISIIDLLLD